MLNKYLESTFIAVTDEEMEVISYSLHQNLKNISLRLYKCRKEEQLVNKVLDACDAVAWQFYRARNGENIGENLKKLIELVEVLNIRRTD